MYSPINVVMKQQMDGAINKAYRQTPTGLQACSRSSLPAVLLACRLVRLLTCLPARRQANQQTAR